MCWLDTNQPSRLFQGTTVKLASCAVGVCHAHCAAASPLDKKQEPNVLPQSSSGASASYLATKTCLSLALRPTISIYRVSQAHVACNSQG